MTRSFLIPLIIVNIFSAALILLALAWPNGVRWFLALFFIGSAFVNSYIAFKKPRLYVEGPGKMALIPAYRSFINGIFARYTTEFVLLIAAGQLFAGLCMAVGEPVLWIGAAGMIVFLLAIAPLGMWSAFPAPVLWAIAALVVAMHH
jgi:hypothetical protein